jgi:hypothetical protein
LTYAWAQETLEKLQAFQAVAVIAMTGGGVKEEENEEESDKTERKEKKNKKEKKDKKEKKEKDKRDKTGKSETLEKRGEESEEVEDKYASGHKKSGSTQVHLPSFVLCGKPSVYVCYMERICYVYFMSRLDDAGALPSPHPLYPSFTRHVALLFRAH